MNIRIKGLAILILMIILYSMTGCGFESMTDTFFSFDGDVLKLNNSEIVVDDLNSHYNASSITDKGNIVYYNDGDTDEKSRDFYTYNPKDKTIKRLNVYQFLDENFIEKIGANRNKLTPIWVVFRENDNVLYFSTYTSRDNDYIRIVRVNVTQGDVKYTPEAYTFVFDPNNSFGVNDIGQVFYIKQENEDIINIYMYDFETSKETIYVNGANYPKTSPNGRYLFYSSDRGYTIRDLEELKEYSLSHDDFSIGQVTFSSSGNSLISVEYTPNPWSLFSATTIGVRQIDFKTGKSKLFFEIKEDENKAILYYDN